MADRISKIVLSSNTNVSHKVSDFKKEIKKENLSEILAGNERKVQSKQDELTDDNEKSFFQKHKVLTALGVLWGTGVLALTIYSIGRNPAKAAKFLKGNSIIPKGSVFEKGQKVADEIFKKHPDIVEGALKVFKEPGYPTQMSGQIAKLEKFLKAEKLPETHEVSKAVASLKQKLEAYISRIRQNAINGGQTDYKAGKKFSETVSAELNEITKYLKEVERDWEKVSKLSFRSYDFKPNIAQYNFDVSDYIGACPEEFLNGRILYHGTMKPANIYKKGFNPFYSRQIGSHSREVGAGVYLTPDSKVANQFTGQIGGIIPVELSKDAKIAIVTDSTHDSIVRRIGDLLFAEYGEAYKKLPTKEQNAIMDCVIRKLFQTAGYDGAYTHKAMKSGLISIFSPDVNKVFGRNQSQVVVFNPEKTTILNRNLFQRIHDVKDNFASFYNQCKNVIKGNV